MRRFNGLTGLGVLFAFLLVLGYSTQASAMVPHPPPPHPHHHHHHWHGPHHGHLGLFFAPRPSGHFETVTETVMIAPERVEQYWVPAEFQTVTDASGNAQQVKVRDGYMASRVIPAQYTTVTRQVWVPGGGPRVGIGLGFGF